MLMSTALMCLAMNVYHEARSENMMGKYAVAHVVMNRVEHKRFPNKVCGVVKQRHQFSWYWDGKSDTPTEPYAWAEAQMIAHDVLSGVAPDITEGALFYHATYVSPYWAKKFTKTVTYGQHIFYRY